MSADPVDPGKQPSKKDGLVRREIRTCTTCGTKFSVTSDSGICPVCILRGSFGEEAASADSLTAASGSGGGSAETKHLSIVRRFEHYEVMLDEAGKPIELGRGAMGVSYKAFDVDLRIPVTLKLISEKYVGDESARLRFLREARAAAKVRHSNVASVFHLGRSREAARVLKWTGRDQMRDLRKTMSLWELFGSCCWALFGIRTRTSHWSSSERVGNVAAA